MLSYDSEQEPGNPDDDAVEDRGDSSWDPNDEYRTKIGGFPRSAQGNGNYCPPDFEFAFQFDSEPKAGLDWIDRGIVNFFRHRSDNDRWSVSFDFL